MLRREGDGQAWWLARQQLMGRRTDPAPVLKVSLVAEGEPAEAAHWAGQLLDRVHQGVRDLDPAAAAGPASTGYGEAFVRHPPGPAGERAARARLAGGGIGTLSLQWPLPSLWRDDDRQDPSISLAVRRFLSDPLWELEVRAAPHVLAEGCHDDLDALWDELLDTAGRLPNTCWGAVSYDVAVPNGTPYETYFAIPDGATTARTHPRGYFPRNFLTAVHLDALGGAERVAARCAGLGLRYEPVPRPGLPAGALVGGHEPTLHTPDTTLAAVRDLLDPILVHEPYHWYAGPPLRVIKEPGTAFRPIPADILDPWFEDDPPLGPDSGHGPRLVPDA